MARLAICLAIVFFIITYVHVNESKPTFISSVFPEQTWHRNIDFPIERMEQPYARLSVEQKLIDADRPKRNCLTYGGKQLHQSSKWMCW